MLASFCRRIVSISLFCFSLSVGLAAAQDAKPNPEQGAGQPATPAAAQVPIADEPKTVDPAGILPAKLVVPVTVNFTESSLNEVLEWIQREQKIPVLIDDKQLGDEGILLGEPVSDRLNNEPLYLLLNRLQSLGLSWYFEDDTVHITTIIGADGRATTQSYVVGDLIDAGYKPNQLVDLIVNSAGGVWESVGGDGHSDPEILGDVLIVRQSEQTQARLAGLLAAVRKHGRQTFAFDPPQHLVLRKKLDENVSVKFESTPLAAIVQKLSQQTGVDIRLDLHTLRSEKIREREPVSITVVDRKLQTVLNVLQSKLGLSWILRDGVMWITTVHEASKHAKTAVYDVRDLCRDADEANSLTEALLNKTGGPWEDVGGEGGTILSPKPGMLVIVATESAHREVLNLLETYRKALRGSKPRKREAEFDPNEVLTRYYRIDSRMADDLVKFLPVFVQRETWAAGPGKESSGTIAKVAGGSEVLDASGRTPVSGETSDSASKVSPLVASRAVLIIKQTRAVHKEIADVIQRIEHGDKPLDEKPARGGAGGGGFGGGFFNVPK